MNGNIEYSRFDPQVNPELICSVVECYREVFGEDPWNEWKKCPNCGEKWGLNMRGAEELEKRQFRHCGVPVQDFWTEDQVRADLLHEISGEGASCWIAMKDGRVIGFCWGYAISPQQLAEKLGREDLAVVLSEQFGGLDRVAYQDEMGVLSLYRGRKVAKEMFRLRREDFLNNGLSVGVIRTKTRPPSVTYQWYMRDGYQIVSQYNDDDGRVVLARSLVDPKPEETRS